MHYFKMSSTRFQLSRENITKLMDLGFIDYDLVSAALQASLNNMDRAAEYLISGKSLIELKEMWKTINNSPMHKVHELTGVLTNFSSSFSI